MKLNGPPSECNRVIHIRLLDRVSRKGAVRKQYEENGSYVVCVVLFIFAFIVSCPVCLVFYCILCYCVSCLVYVCYMCMAASAK